MNIDKVEKYKCVGEYPDEYNNNSHRNYLKTSCWQHIRDSVLSRDNYECKICFSKTGLRVHHITYKNWKNEDLDDLVCLCKKCHDNIHGLCYGDDFVYIRTESISKYMQDDIEKVSISDFVKSNVTNKNTSYSEFPTKFLDEDYFVDFVGDYMYHRILSFTVVIIINFAKSKMKITPKPILDKLPNLEYLNFKKIVDDFGYLYGLKWVAIRVGAKRSVHITLDNQN